MSSSDPTPTPASSRSTWWQHVVSAILLVLAAGLVTWTLARASEHPRVNPVGAIIEFSTPAEQAAHLHDVVGTFATGNTSGDRTIVVAADGRVTFQIVGPLTNPLTVNDTFRLAKRGDHANLVTLHSGVIQQDDIDHLTYCGDSYERQK